MSLRPCQACGRHHRAVEAACPHCGVACIPTGGSDLVRNLKVGALLTFTAFATAACYGSPNYVGPGGPNGPGSLPGPVPDAGASQPASPKPASPKP